MEFLPVMAAAMAISLVVIPLMVRHAVRFGLVDEPDPRKVHHMPVPRVGGAGIVLGALIPVGVALRDEPLMLTYIFGAVVLTVFGLWDDRKELGHYVKFVGQIIAVVPVVYIGDLYVSHFPLVGEGAVPEAVARAFTLIALVGMINAMNHSDGLDGLAGGEALLSLGVLGFLFFLSGALPALIVVVATIGGVFGFLRYNTHPAGVFMGDAGSQFLGFTIGFLLILLTQQADPSLSPAVVLLIVGLPIADILVVFWKRARSGKNWFRATRNHVHHRLLHLGFMHHEAVILIYVVQLFFLAAAIWLRHAPDGYLLAVYLGVCLLLFGGMALAERRAWRFEPFWRGQRWLSACDATGFYWRVRAPRRLLEYGIPLYLVASSLRVGEIPTDAAATASVLFALLLMARLSNLRLHASVRSALVFAASAVVIYLSHDYLELPSLAGMAEAFVLVLFALSIVVAMRYSPRRRKREFVPTATDFLVIIMLVLAIVAQGDYLEFGVPGLAGMIFATGVVFYGCELLITERREHRHLLDLATLLAMAILTTKGLLSL